MKKGYYLIIIVLLICCMFIFVRDLNYVKVHDDTYKAAIVVGGVKDMEPYSYINRQGIYTGFSVDVMNLIAEELDIKIIYKKIDIENIVDELNNKKIDLILGAQYGTQSFSGLQYTKPFIKNYFNIFVLNSTNNIRKLDDLEGKVISVYRWDPAYQRIKNISGIRLYVCDDQEAAYKLLKYGMADAYVANSSLAFNYIEGPLYSREIKIVGQKIDALPSGAVTLKENQELVKLINSAIDKVTASKKINVLYDKWFGSRIGEKQSYLYKIIYSVAVIGFFLLIIVLFVYRINTILKRQVHEKTLDIKKEVEFKKEIINSISDLLVTIDNEYIITTLNNKTETFEKSKERIEIGQNIKNTHVIDIIDIKAIESIINGADEENHGEKKININGIDNYFEYTVTKINYDSVIIGATIIIKDVTEKVTIKNNLVMKDKMRTIGQLTAGIAHEIRNPLTSIDVYIKLLPNQIDNEEFRNQLLEDLPLEISRMNCIVEDLLDYAKPNIPNIISFNLKNEIDDIIRLRKKNTDFGDLSVKTNIDSKLNILFDKNNFRQIIINLLSNAVDAVKNAENPSVLVYTKEYDKVYDIIIEDNGLGIAENNLEKIFEPLFTTKKEGNGLGLAIVSQLIKENNAVINVNSEVNRGTKFIITAVK